MMVVKMNSINLSLFIYITNFIGIIAFSISGFFKAEKYSLDIFGALILGIITSIGGGMLRDIILNDIPNVIKNHHDLYLSAIVILIFSSYYKLKKEKNILFSKHREKIIKIVLISDAVGLSIFTIIGSEIAMSKGFDLVTIVIIATITSVGGGIFRDLLVNETPIILKEDVYAILCILGSIMYTFLIKYYIINQILSTLITFLFIFIIRLVVILYKLNLPLIKNNK